MTETLYPGPCVVCGRTNYPLSMGGSTLCPRCDCGDWNSQKLLAELKQTREELAALRARPASPDAAMEAAAREITHMFVGLNGFPGIGSDAGAGLEIKTAEIIARHLPQQAAPKEHPAQGKAEVRPEAFRLRSDDGTVDTVQREQPSEWDIEHLHITPLYSSPEGFVRVPVEPTEIDK